VAGSRSPGTAPDSGSFSAALLLIHIFLLNLKIILGHQLLGGVPVYKDRIFISIFSILFLEF